MAIEGISSLRSDPRLPSAERAKVEKEEEEEARVHELHSNELTSYLPPVAVEFFSEISATRDIDGAGNALVSAPVQFDGFRPMEPESKTSIVFFMHNRDLVEA